MSAQLHDPATGRWLPRDAWVIQRPDGRYRWIRFVDPASEPPDDGLEPWPRWLMHAAVILTAVVLGVVSAVAVR